jgi:hypothetical protein
LHTEGWYGKIKYHGYMLLELDRGRKQKPEKKERISL